MEKWKQLDPSDDFGLERMPCQYEWHGRPGTEVGGRPCGA